MKKALSIIIKFLPLANGLLGLILPAIVFAAQYQLLESIPGEKGVEGTVELSSYLESLFFFGISLAGILAVVAIVVGGIQYIIAYGNPGQIENAKNRITQALLGLLLTIGAWLILYTINPDLAKGTLDIPSIDQTTTTTTTGNGATGTY